MKEVKERNSNSSRSMLAIGYDQGYITGTVAVH
jgi:hypothetical protein